MPRSQKMINGLANPSQRFRLDAPAQSADPLHLTINLTIDSSINAIALSVVC